MSIFFPLLVALVVTMVLIPPLMRAAPRLGMLDISNERKVHSNAVPRIGGIAMAAGTVLAILLWAPLQREVEALLYGIGIILLFGIWDDRVDLDYRLKFLGQLLAALVVVAYGGIVIERLPLYDGEAIPAFLSIPLTIVVLIGVINAINLADGLDGLVGGTTLLIFGCMAVLANFADGVSTVIISLAFSGAILGFLRFNTHPARVFMGDAGSQVLGISAGALALSLTQEVNTALSPALPLLLFGLPILDTLSVMAQRLREGRSPFSPDKNHIHHKLLALGFDQYEAVLLIYLVQASLVLSAYFFRYESDAFIVFIYGLFCASCLLLFHLAERREWRVRETKEGVSLVTRGARHIKQRQWLVKGPQGFLKTAIPGLLLLGALTAESIPRDYGVVSLGVLFVLILALLARSISFSMIEHASVYVASAFAVYLLHRTLAGSAGLQLTMDLFFLVFAAVVGVGIRYAEKDRFRLTPLDFLVLFICLTVPYVSVFQFAGDHGGMMVAELMVVLYGCELVLTATARPRHWVQAGTFGTLLVLGIRGVL